jgi:hypothetical protein
MAAAPSKRSGETRAIREMNHEDVAKEIAQKVTGK